MADKTKDKGKKDDKTWFERDEHKPVRTCTCVCGDVFKSEARDLTCIQLREVKDKNGRPVFDKHGNREIKKVVVKRMLSKWSCKKCSSNWLESFR